jgi:hypothetical protein
LPTLALQAQTTPLVEQLLALDPSGQPLDNASVLPIWSRANGELLAVVTLPRDWIVSPVDAVPAYRGPSSWALAGSNGAANGLVWSLPDGLRIDAMLGQYLPAMPIACAAPGCTAAASWSRGTLTGALGMGWASADGGLDLSYGLSWLQSPANAPSLGDLAITSLPTLALPDAPLYSLGRETSIYAHGRWRFEQGPALDIAASYGHGKLSAIDGLAGPASAIDLDQLSLSLGLDAGSLRGAIVGHVLSSDDPALAGKRWTTLDLGVSWRTPWSGELSVGAQNLWSAPLNSPRDSDNQARTPYIQYRQDL